MKCLRLTLVFFLICVVPRQSHGSFLEIFRKLAEGDQNSKTSDQISPSPTPAPSENLDSGNQPKAENCDEVFNKCDIKDYNVTACVPFVGNGFKTKTSSYVLVLNNGESPLALNMTVHPANIIFENLEISQHRVNKVTLPPNTGRDSSILVNVGNGECVIRIGASIPQGFYTDYLTPINGTYLLFAAGLLFGGIWACFKLKTRRHLDGVPYKELEMGQKESDPSFVDNTSNGWDQNWDDGWDEEKAVSGNDDGNGLKNRASLKYVDPTQWGSDWED